MTIDYVSTITTIVSIFALIYLGALTWSTNRSSLAHRLFFALTLTTATWSMAMVFSVNASRSDAMLLWFRAALFFAIPASTLLPLIIAALPGRSLRLPTFATGAAIFLLAAIMVATLSPLVIPGVTDMDGAMRPVPGPFLPLPIIVIAGALATSLILAAQRQSAAEDAEQGQWRIILFGMLASYGSLIALFRISTALPTIGASSAFGPLSTLPLVVAFAYTLMHQHVQQRKALATEFLVFIMLTLVLVDVFNVTNTPELILRIATFAALVGAGILLIRSVREDVAQRNKLQEMTYQLTVANERLERVDRVKDRFLSFASHQVKAPLSVMKGYATLIEESNQGGIPESVRMTARKIRESVDRLVTLVDDFLDIRRIEDGEMDFSFTRSNVRALVASVLDELAPLAAAKNLQMNPPNSGAPLWALIDASKLHQAIQNIIENAIKYTDSGSVAVTLTTERQSILITVQDTGRGIPADVIQNIFEEYSRDPALAKEIEGSGLGLAIAKHIIIAHRGEVWAQSEGPGKGSTFFVRIPLSRSTELT